MIDPVDWNGLEATWWKHAQANGRHELDQSLFMLGAMVGQLTKTIDELVAASNMLEGRLNAMQAALSRQ